MTEAMIQVKTAEALELTLHQLIPLSRAMAVTVDQFTRTHLVLRAPLAPNINHQGSAFGGSLTAISALTGWGMVQLQLGLMDITANTVVGHADTRFMRPVFGPLVCHAQLPEAFGEFKSRLRDSGKASIYLETFVVHEGETAMQATSQFFVRSST